MTNEAKYPKRGQMSDDGKVFTNLEGVVLRKDSIGSVCDAKYCQACINKDGWCAHWNVVEGAYVPSDCELEACEMARTMILHCRYYRSLASNCKKDEACERCSDCSNKSCPARKYLFAHGDAQAWEAK